MLNRREFLQVAAAGGATLAVSSSAAFSAEPAGGATAALRPECCPNTVWRKSNRARCRTAFPGRWAPTAKGTRSAAEAATKFRSSRRTRALRAGPCLPPRPEVAQKLIGTRLDELFDLASGTTDLVPQEMDRAFHDLVGNILQKPVYELLGGRGPREVALYSGAIYLEDVMPPDKPRGVRAVLDACQQDYEAGYRALKLKIGRGFKWMPGMRDWLATSR